MSAERPAPHGADGRAGPLVQRAGGELQLIVGGAVQSVGVRPDETPHGYWRALVPTRQPTSALILGLGGGTAAHLLRRKWPQLPITGVDDDQQVLSLACRHFGIEELGVEAVRANARKFVRACRRRYGVVIVDLFRGETLAAFAGQREFIRRVRTLVEPGGTLVWNLHRDPRSQAVRRRAGAGLQLEGRVLAGLNLVLHFRRRVYRRTAKP